MMQGCRRPADRQAGSVNSVGRISVPQRETIRCDNLRTMERQGKEARLVVTFDSKL